METTTINNIENIKLPILMYHHFIGDDEKLNSPVRMKEKNFIEQIKYIKDSGYTSITCNDLLLYKKGEKNLPQKPILITADDGCKSNYTFMYKILNEYEMKATIFVIVKRLDNLTSTKNSSLNWHQAREMLKSGIIDIQSHTCNSHSIKDTIYGKKGEFSAPLLGETINEYRNRIDKDMKLSISKFQDELGYSPIALAYPFGEYSEVSEEIIKANGIEMSFTVNRGFALFGQSTYLLNRIGVSSFFSMNRFKMILIDS